MDQERIKEALAKARKQVHEERNEDQTQTVVTGDVVDGGESHEIR